MLLAWLLQQLGHVPVSSTAAEAMAAVTRALAELGRAYILRDDFGPLGPFAWAYGLSVNLPQGLREDYQHIVGSSDDLPSDAQLAQLQQVFAQRLAEFEAADRASAAPGA